MVSGTISRAPAVAHGVFQSALRDGLPQPWLRTIRSALLYRLADIFNFFLPLRWVQPLPVRARFCQGPRAEQFFLLFVSAPSGVSAGPRPVLGRLHQGGALGVSFHVANHGQEMTVGFDPQRLVAALINVAVSDRPGTRVITLRVGQGEASQEFREIAVRSGIKHQMPMIRHQAVSQNAHGHKIQALFHDTEKIFIMRSFSEQPRAEVRAVQRMINRPANIHSPRSAHNRILSLFPRK